MPRLISELEKQFTAIADPHIAFHQKKYMKNRFDFFGIQSKPRKEATRKAIKITGLPAKEEMPGIIRLLWEKDQREYQYSGQELFFRFRKQFDINDLEIIECMITRKSWWDTVDFIAAKLAGHYFKCFPEQIPEAMEKWIDSGNLWLQRSALLFQLSYKDNTDTGRLEQIIEAVSPTDEFFINKATGWILRQYSKTNPAWVREYVNTHTLHPVAYREAVKYI